MAQPPDDPFWDTIDDATPAVPRSRLLARAPQGAGPISPISVITEPDFGRQAPPGNGSSRLGDVSRAPLHEESSDASGRIVTSSLRSPEDMPLSGTDLRTTFSNQGVMIADLVRERFAGKSYGKAFYRPRLDEPDGPSTAGGLLARQPISLVPRLDVTPTIVCGWVDVAKRDSQLRSYWGVTKRHLNRQGGALPITEEEYERFLDELMNALFESGIRIKVLVPDEPEASPPQPQEPPRPRPSRSFLGALLLVVLGFALGLNAERLWAWSGQVAPWIHQVPSWLDQVPSWLERVPSWLEAWRR